MNWNAIDRPGLLLLAAIGSLYQRFYKQSHGARMLPA